MVCIDAPVAPLCALPQWGGPHHYDHVPLAGVCWQRHGTVHWRVERRHLSSFPRGGSGMGRRSIVHLDEDGGGEAIEGA